MPPSVKYLALTVLCVAAGVCAFAGAYAVFDKTRSARQVGDTDAPPPLVESAQASPAEENAPGDAPEAEEAASIEDRINENTEIVYEYYYADEDRTETASQKAPPALLSLTREQLIARIEGFAVVSFSPSKVVLKKNIGGRERKYIIGIWDGRVAVFYSGGDGGIKEVTDTPVSSLSEYEREMLEEGIVIETESELMKALEDYGS